MTKVDDTNEKHKKNEIKTTVKNEEEQNNLIEQDVEQDYNNIQKRNQIYIGYYPRIIIYTVLFITLILLGIKFGHKSLNITEKKVINYSEKSNLDYRVYLKENDFYEEEYLDKNMVYVASLIDKVKIDFDYNFISDKNIDLNFNYKVIATLLITNSNERKTYFKKDYILLEKQTIELEDQSKQVINNSIEIDYDYYNSLANKFKSSYGVDTESKLLVNLLINKENRNEKIDINKDSLMSVTIPLSESSVNIAIDYKDVNNHSKIIAESSIKVDNGLYMFMAIILVGLALIMVINSIKLLTLLKTNKSNYDKYIGKLLNEYDRLIVETTTYPIMKGNDIIKVSNFQELLDVRDNLKLPIMYYVVTKHQKCYFYIMHENKFYLNIVKAVDLENNNQ